MKARSSTTANEEQIATRLEMYKTKKVATDSINRHRILHSIIY